MSRYLPCLGLLALAGCRSSSTPRDPVRVIQPAAEIPAPARLVTPNVTEPPAPAPTAKGTYTSMTPPFMQHTPPRPHTR